MLVGREVGREGERWSWVVVCVCVFGFVVEGGGLELLGWMWFEGVGRMWDVSVEFRFWSVFSGWCDGWRVGGGVVWWYVVGYGVVVWGWCIGGNGLCGVGLVLFGGVCLFGWF